VESNFKSPNLKQKCNHLISAPVPVELTRGLRAGGGTYSLLPFMLLSVGKSTILSLCDDSRAYLVLVAGQGYFSPLTNIGNKRGQM
jgi:hypothetical protein